RHILVLDLERLDKQILICKESGIFRLENHGVPLKLTSQLQEISESLLSLPFEEKQELFAAVNSPLLYFWGTPALNRSGDAFKRGTQASYVNMVEVFNVPLSSLPKLPRDCVIKSSNYKPFTYSEFDAQVQADFQSLGTKVGLHRFSPKSPLFL
ncbi:hypothetical protein HID58_038594, partial [Brassica napus]